MTKTCRAHGTFGHLVGTVPSIAWVVGWVLSLVLLAGPMQPSGAHAQETEMAHTIEDLLKEDPDAALSGLSDSELRAVVLDFLRDKSEQGEDISQFNPADLAFVIQDTFGRIRDRAGEVFGAFPELPGVFATSFARIIGEQSAGQFGAFLVLFTLSLGISAAGERWLRARMHTVGLHQLPAQGRFAGKLVVILRRFLTEIAYIAVFCALAAAVYFLFGSEHNSFRATFIFYMTAMAITRTALAGTAVFYAPKAPGVRLPAYSDQDAGRMKRMLSITVGLGAFGFFTCALFAVHGVIGHAHQLVLVTTGTITTAVLVVSIVANRRAISNDLLSVGVAPGSVRQIVAKVYPGFVAGTFVVMWIGVVLSAFAGATPLYGAALTTVFVLIGLPSLDAAMEREANQYASEGAELTAAVGRTSRIGLLVAAVLILAISWRVRLFDLAGTGLGTQVTHALLQAGATVTVAYMLWQAVRIWIDRKIKEEEEEFAKQSGIDLAEMEIGGAGQSRLRTLLPLIKRTIQITLVLVTFMFVMSSIGVDIGPLLAGAGVVGLAVGFGSQTLVRDVVSGLFFLLDDAFRLGEYVDVGSARGSIEKISIRSFQLRHHLGAVNTVPFGEISVLQNFSRDWAIMKLRFRVGFDADLEKVRKIMKQVGKELLERPEIAEDFLQPFKSQGVLEVDDYGFVVRAKFMSKPGKQFLIRRYAYMAVQKAFADHGIKFARPEVRVLVDEDEERQIKAAEETIGAGAQAVVNKEKQKASETTAQ